MKKAYKNLQTAVKHHLAEYLGVSDDDISVDDYLKDDLHMSFVDISDFMHHLKEIGITTNSQGVSKITTVADLIDLISENEEL